MPDNHVRLFCGEAIERTKVDPGNLGILTVEKL
jgi:hypothetical protein